MSSVVASSTLRLSNSIGLGMGPEARGKYVLNNGTENPRWESRDFLGPYAESWAFRRRERLTTGTQAWRLAHHGEHLRQRIPT